MVTKDLIRDAIDHSRIGHPHFELVRHDVVDRFMIEVDQIYHLACPASPSQYQSNPIKTVKTRYPHPLRPGEKT